MAALRLFWLFGQPSLMTRCPVSTTPSALGLNYPPAAAVAEPLYERPKDIASRYGITSSEVYRAVYAGELKVTRFKSRVLLIRPADAAAWFEANIQSA